MSLNCEAASKYILQDKLIVKETQSEYIVKSPRGVVLLNRLQYEILMRFSETPITLNDIYMQYNNLPSDKLKNLLDKFIFEKLILDTRTNRLQKKTIGYYFRMLTRIELPSRRLIVIIKKCLASRNMTWKVVSSLICISLSIYCNIRLIPYTGFLWNQVERWFGFLLIGIAIAFYHEVWMAAFIIRYGGEHTIKFKLRILLGVFISVVVGWEYLLTIEKKKTLRTFLLVDLFTIALCSKFAIIGFLFMCLSMKSLAYMFCTFSIIGYSYMLINLWPFLLKGDGYNMFCIYNNVARLRNYFLRLIYSVVCRKPIDFIPKGKLLLYLLWGFMFVLSLVFIEYAFYHGLRLRI